MKGWFNDLEEGAENVQVRDEYLLALDLLGVVKMASLGMSGSMSVIASSWLWNGWSCKTVKQAFANCSFSTIEFHVWAYSTAGSASLHEGHDLLGTIRNTLYSPCLLWPRHCLSSKPRWGHSPTNGTSRGDVFGKLGSVHSSAKIKLCDEESPVPSFCGDNPNTSRFWVVYDPVLDARDAQHCIRWRPCICQWLQG